MTHVAFSHDRWRSRGLRTTCYFHMMATIRWQPEAEQRLGNVPFFIRPFVRWRAESAAAARGLAEVDCELLDEMKGQEHRGSTRPEGNGE